jgi:integrase
LAMSGTGVSGMLAQPADEGKLPQASPGWEAVDRLAEASRQQRDTARTPAEFQAVGWMARDLMAALARAVYDPRKHLPLDNGPPLSKGDSKRMLDAYLGAELPDGDRTDARLAVDVAWGLTQRPTTDYQQAAKCLAAVNYVLEIVRSAVHSKEARLTVRELCSKYIEETPSIGRTHRGILERIAKCPIGAKVASQLQPEDILEHVNHRRKEAESRRKGGRAGPATLTHDITFLRGVLKTAGEKWHMDVTTEAVDTAKRALTKHQLISPSQRRTRLPKSEEIELLLQHYKRHGEHPRTRIRMKELIEFALASGLRRGEICSLRWNDLQPETRSIKVQIRGPGNRATEEVLIPLTQEAWDIIQRQPTRGKDRIFPYNGNSVGASFVIATRAQGIPNLRFNDFRRECAKRLAKHYSLEDVARFLNRKDLTSLKEELEQTE